MSSRTVLLPIECTLLIAAALAGECVAADDVIATVRRVPEFRGTRQLLGVNEKYADELKVDISLEKNVYSLGEPILASVRIENRSLDRSYRLCWPYSGHRVSTLSTWTRRRDGEWGPLKPALLVNRGNYDDERIRLVGTPLVVAPQSIAKSAAFLNVHESLRDKTMPTWEVGIGFKLPGQYELYVQYLNIDALRPGVLDKDVDEFPLTPVVFGPYAIEIRDSKTDSQAIQEAITAWEKTVAPTDNFPFVDPASIVPIIPRLREAREEGAADALMLFVRSEQLRIALRTNSAADIREARESLSRLSTRDSGLLAERFRIAEYYALLQAGRISDARKVAASFDSPDGLVLKLESEK